MQSLLKGPNQLLPAQEKTHVAGAAAHEAMISRARMFFFF
jgi:hypothetical protein